MVGGTKTPGWSQAAADVALQQKQAKQTEGSLIAGYGASGVTMEGSPTEVLRMSVENAALDEQNIKYTGRLKSLGFTNESLLDTMEGKTAIQQGYLTAASSILTGAGQGAHSYMTAKQGYVSTFGP